uniref:Lipocalin/cytosolic fatty-acid binding domain-containing protein n=1 Tax=Oryzias latipes TaxID=8090 RepID=A0A3P9KP81_ORYLA
MPLLFRDAALLLVLLGCCPASAEDDCDLPLKVERHDLHQLSDVRWVLVEAFTDYPAGQNILRSAGSSTVEMKHNGDNRTFLITEAIRANGTCIFFRFNMSIPDPDTSNHSLHLVSAGVKEVDGEVSPYDDQGRAHMYQFIPGSLVTLYNLVFQGRPARTLLMYRREGEHQDIDELNAASSEHRRIAECLKFNVPADFLYDGKTETCPDERKSQTDD